MNYRSKIFYNDFINDEFSVRNYTLTIKRFNC